MPTYLQRVITRLEVPLSTTENLPVHWFVLQLYVTVFDENYLSNTFVDNLHHV